MKFKHEWHTTDISEICHRCGVAWSSLFKSATLIVKNGVKFETSALAIDFVDEHISCISDEEVLIKNIIE